MPRLAVCLDDLRLETKEAMERARRLGFSAIDASAAEGPLCPEALSSTGRRHLKKHLADLGLRLVSLRGPVSGPGMSDATTAEKRLDRLLHIIDLAVELGVPVVSTSIGTGSELDDPINLDRVREGLSILADRADRRGVVAALETSGVSTPCLGELVRRIHCPNLAACCDSGAMILRGEDPHEVADELAGYIRLVRARDALAGGGGAGGQETAMGEGALDLPRFLAGLDRAGFDGELVLSRTDGSNPVDDILRARRLFEQAMR